MEDLLYRSAIGGVVIIGVLARLYIQELYPSRQEKPRLRQDRRWSCLFSLLGQASLGGVVLAQMIGWSIAPLSLGAEVVPVVRLSGLGLLALALAGGNWVRLVRQGTWGEAGVNPKHIHRHELLVNGPYRFIRHPFYLSILLAFIGIELALASWAVGLVVVILVYGLSVIRKEERALAEKYPGEFEMYKNKTWKLIPCVY